MTPLALLVLTAVTSADPAPATWPQWRGPTRDGVVKPAAPWPGTLTDDNFKQLWRVENLGPSYSGPVVSADKVFTTETVGKTTEVVTAFDRATGKKLWDQKWPGAMTVPFFAAANGSWIRSTPAYDDGKLYVAGIRDLLVCLDAATGAILWKVDFPAELKTEPPAFGFVCSPLVGPDGVYVQAGAGFCKLDKATGKTVWRVLADDGGMNGSAFSSPVFGTFHGTAAVVVQTRTKLAGVDPKTGTVLWSRVVPTFRGMNILTPVQVGNAVFTSTYGGTTQLFNVSAAGGALAPEDGWAVKYEGNMSSPVVVENHAYFLGKDQRLVCFDLKAGKQAWRSDKSFGKYWSLAAAGDKILGLDERGKLYLFKANPKELEILGERQAAKAEAWAHLAVAGSEVFVRDLYGLTAFAWGNAK